MKPQKFAIRHWSFSSSFRPPGKSWVITSKQIDPFFLIPSQLVVHTLAFIRHYNLLMRESVKFMKIKENKCWMKTNETRNTFKMAYQGISLE